MLQWTESTDEHVRSYVNGIPTGSGGTHENGLRAGLGKAVRNYIDTHTLSPKGVTLVAEDIREGLTGVVSIFIKEPQFQGQTKDRLNNPELTSAIDSAVRPALEHWLNHNRSVAEAIVGRVILAARRSAQVEQFGDQGLRALLPAGQDTLAITPYSQMVYERAHRVQSDTSFFRLFAGARLQAESAFGFDPVSVMPSALKCSNAS